MLYHTCKIFILLFSIINFVCCTNIKGKYVKESKQTTSTKSETFTHNPYSLKLIDQYYKILTGQNNDSLILDTVSGMTNVLLSQYWVIPADSVRFKMIMGISIDEEYTNELVQKAVFEKVNEYLAHGFNYDITSEDQAKILNIGADVNKSIKDFLSEWESIFHKISKLNGYEERDSILPYMRGSGGGTVCHKIYEDINKTTYMIEGLIDYHNSSGDPTQADYLTINKSTGEVLSLSDVSNDDRMENLIVDAYLIFTESMGYHPCSYNGKELLESADGVAIINVGLLFYYHPYKIGVGAEGQFNLIIPIPLKIIDNYISKCSN